MRISLLILAAATILIPTAAARAQQAREDCWIDVKTGKSVPTAPLSGVNMFGAATIDGAGSAVVSEDRKTAFNPKTGKNYAKESDGSWVDVKTGKSVPTAPLSGVNISAAATIDGAGTAVVSEDRRTAFNPKNGKNYARVPCPLDQLKTAAQPPPTGGQGSVPAVKLKPFDQRILDLHNAERSAVGAPPLRWNPALEQSATTWAQQLARTGQLVHAPREGRGIERENLSQGRIGWGPDQLMRNWLNEKSYFRPGIFPNVCTGDWSQCAHYSQVIWPTTTDLGCGMARGSGYQWLVCRYAPGGNKPGKPVGMPPLAAGGTASAAPPLQARNDCWIDVKTGKRVNTIPGGALYVEDGRLQSGYSSSDPNRAFNPKTGKNYARSPDGGWIDTKTGQQVNTIPGGALYVEDGRLQSGYSSSDQNRAFNPETGRNFARIPCSQPRKPAPERG